MSEDTSTQIIKQLRQRITNLEGKSQSRHHITADNTIAPQLIEVHHGPGLAPWSYLLGRLVDLLNRSDTTRGLMGAAIASPHRSLHLPDIQRMPLQARQLLFIRLKSHHTMRAIHSAEILLASGQCPLVIWDTLGFDLPPHAAPWQRRLQRASRIGHSTLAIITPTPSSLSSHDSGHSCGPFIQERIFPYRKTVAQSTMPHHPPAFVLAPHSIGNTQKMNPKAPSPQAYSTPWEAWEGPPI